MTLGRDCCVDCCRIRTTDIPSFINQRSSNISITIISLWRSKFSISSTKRGVSRPCIPTNILSNHAIEKFQTLDASQRYLIALAGIPGSGKTTVASLIAHGLNELHHNAFHSKFPNSAKRQNGRAHPSQPDAAFVVPLDGYHLTRKQLSEMADPEEAVYRRGAAFTFDARKYLALVLKLRKPIEAGTRTIHAPSFDHAVKDPVEDDIHIPPTARIIILEGLYTAMDREGWRDAAQMMDETWFVDCPIDVATLRVAKRNFAAGLSPSYEESLDRTKKSDMRNAREILDNRLPINETITSIEDEAWKSEEIKLAEEDEEVNEQFRPVVRTRVDSIAELVEAGAGM